MIKDINKGADIDLSRIALWNARQYLEAQFMGGIDLARGDVKLIRFPRHRAQKYKHVTKLAKKYNIPVEQY